jgi:HEAT repeat protein
MQFAWLSRLNGGTSRVEALARRGDVARLIELAGAAGSRVSPAAYSRLMAMDTGDAAPAVRAALRHRSDPIRCAAIRILGQWGDASALAQAVFWLPPQGASRRLALAVIGQLRQPKSAPVLAGSLVAGTAQEGLREEEVGLVLALCRSSGNPAVLGRVIDVLAEAFEVDDNQIAHRAEDFLWWLGEDAVPAVTALAQSSAAPERAVWVLGQIGGASVVEPLSEALEHSDARTREQACIALGELRDPASVEALMRATRDREYGVRVAAASALDRIGTAAVLTALSAPVSGPNGSSSARRNGVDDTKNRAGRKSRTGPRVEAKGS